MKFVMLVLILLAQVTVQQSPPELMQQANEAYRNGDYRTAIELYETLLADEFRDPAVYFNLGNAYYQSGQLGWAMLNYRRAQLIDPRDRELDANLARVRAQRVDYQGNESTPIDFLASSTTSVVTLGELAWLVFIVWSMWFGLAALWITRLRWRTRLRSFLVVVGLVVLAGLTLLGTRLYADSERPSAVVVDLSVQVMSGPGDGYLPIFQIFAAAEIRVLEVRGQWLRFVMPNGRQGWIPRETVETV